MGRTCSTQLHIKFWEQKPDGKTPLVRPRDRWKDLIKIDTKVIGSEAAGWIHFDL
jgi:hypothetical protein